MIERDLEHILIEWQHSTTHLPILLRGARQVGKSYLVEHFAKKYFKKQIIINLELSPEYKSCFATLNPKEIVSVIELLTNTNMTPGDTLLFIDEIQECPNAIMALRYFKEQMPALHVIAAGSLLEFTLNQENFRMPVGRVQFCYLKPLSFKEFLNATHHEKLREFIETIAWNTPIPSVIHQKLLELVRLYCIIGGMPAVISAYLENNSLKKARDMQHIILSTYQADFGKYAGRIPLEQLQLIFTKAPNIVTKQLKYTEISRDIQSRELKRALEKLVQANLLHQVFSTNATGLPLSALINPKKFKLLFLDTGLIQCSTRIDADILLQEALIGPHNGMITEHFVGQELLAYQDPLLSPEIYYWERDERNANAELDYVISISNRIIPIEVKAGSSVKLKSLHLFMQERASPIGIHIATHSLALNNKIAAIPLYLVSELERLIRIA